MNRAWKHPGVSTVLVHVIAWVAVYALPLFVRPDFSNHNPELLKGYKHIIIFGIVLTRGLWILIFYLNAQLFIPRFFYRQKFAAYCFALLASVFGIFLADFLFFTVLIPPFEYKVVNFLYFHLFPIFFILVASSAYRLILDHSKAVRDEQDKIHENLKTELSLLRSQVSPHFMFNVLNNMVAMARKKSDLLEDSLIKLSQLLRYMLYETEHKVSLGKELEYLQSYIDLQKQRFGNLVSVQTLFEIEDENLEIEPMLLIPFVENAFKHGTVTVNDPEILTEIRNKGKELQLHVRNKYKINHNEVKDATSGIGLENVKRRLKLLYPNRYTLHIDQSGEIFDVKLQINLA